MPKLAKGETARGVKSKADACRVSALNRSLLLRRILARDAGARSYLSSFSSLMKLAALSLEEERITPLSEKTLRRYLEKVHPGGYAKFTADVSEALNRVTGVAAVPDRREHEVDAVLKSTERYLDLLDRFKKIAMLSEVGKRELTYHFRIHGDTSDSMKRVK